MAAFNANDISAITGTGSHIEPPTSPVTTAIMPAPELQLGTSGFLVLAPVTSATYPPPDPSTATGGPLAPAATPAEPAPRDRRSSSVGSEGPLKQRILKLGPYHGGKQNGNSDYVEIEM